MKIILNPLKSFFFNNSTHYNWKMNQLLLNKKLDLMLSVLLKNIIF